MRNLSWLLLTGVILLGAAGASAGTIWNVATDYSATSNPNSAWAYGSLDPAMTFTTYTTPETANPGGGGLFAGWHDSDWDINGNVGKNVGSSPIPTSAWGFYAEVGQIIMGAPNSNRGTTIRWTAPADMTVDVSATFTGQAAGVWNAQVYVFVNNTNMFQQTLTGYGATQSYSGTISLTAGNVLYFAMDGAGGGAGKQTGLAATITEVPEPMTLSLLALGSLGVVIRRKR